MIDIQHKTECCGCTACANICPEKCITMLGDKEGFLYPVIQQDKCIHCDLCEAVCPVRNKISVNDREVKTYAVRSRDMENVEHSTSGGVFVPLAKYVLERNGVICAAAYDEDFFVKHLIIDKNSTRGGGTGLNKFRGSKYVQSSLGDCYSKIKELLKSGCQVCFIGTPCQVSGLKNFLKRDYEDLLTVDLVCHGTPSPKLWMKYIQFQTETYKSNISAISFRSKRYGYHSGGFMEIRFMNGKTYCGSARVDPMLRSFFKEIASRPICYECPFKGLNRCSDLTLYDCWHFSRLVENAADDDRGYTNVIVQSDKGGKVLAELGDAIESYPVNTEDAKRLDGIMIENCAASHPRRCEYYADLDEHTIPEHIQKYIPVSKKDHLIENAKRPFYQMGILQKIKMRKVK